MAPGSHLQSDSPSGKDIQSMVREVLLKELTLEHRPGLDPGSVIIQLKLGDKKVGKAFRLSINWKQDHGHGGGSYVNGLTISELE